MHHIVFVDDTPYNLELASAYLEVTASSDIHVNCFNQAELAIQACQHSAPDLIFLDLEMPGKNGFETIRELRTFCHAPVVAMTGHSEASIKTELIAYNFNDYLGKPFSDSALIGIVNKHIPGLTRTITKDNEATLPQHGNALNLSDMARRLRNNQKLIIRILDSFQNNNTHTFSAFNTALDTQDWVSAKRICHTLKGGGANIGAETLSAFAAQLETACGQRQRPDKEQLAHLQFLIDSAITHCRSHIAAQHNAPARDEAFYANVEQLFRDVNEDLVAVHDRLLTMESKYPTDQAVRQCVIAFNEFRIDDIKETLAEILRAQ